MKTKPMEHQIVGLAHMAANVEFYALACEQGTGKTWMLLADAERQYKSERIDAMLVVAPKGVHTNWTRREIPKHMSVEARTAHYASGMGKRRTKEVERLNEPDPKRLTVLSINIDALNTETGYAAAAKFLKAHKVYMIVDESTRIKSPESKRTQKTIKLGTLAKTRRIASGTMIAHSPLDAFSQFEFMKSGLLGTTSYRAFVSRFAKIHPPESSLVRHAKERRRYKRGPEPQIVMTDSLGRPLYRNLDVLAELMAPYTYRVTKAECTDLPEKVYQTYDFEMSAAQRRAYEMVAEELRYERDNGMIDSFTALTKLNKLRQITSGFIMLDGEATSIEENSPRLDLLESILGDVSGQKIVWAVYREELKRLAGLFRDCGITFCEYHGGVKDKDREIAVDGFQAGDFEIFLGNPQSGGTGLTLGAAETAIYYSNDFSAENRLQSEDRNHRIGAKGGLYIDIVASGTIDERIAENLQGKKEISQEIYDEL